MAIPTRRSPPPVPRGPSPGCRLAATKKSLQRNIKGVQNVYTKHSPYLAQTLDAVLKDTLTETQQPPPAHGRRLPTPAPAQPRKSRRL